MTAQQAVLQVVILRDGLLVGTEVFVPGSYSVGSGSGVEVKLDDPSVDPLHAVLYFQNGRAAIQDNNSRGGLYVNGHRIRACEVRSQDEILCGPFVLKTRVVAKQPAMQKPSPSPEVAALLGAPAAPPPAPAPAPAPVARAAPPPPAHPRVAPLPSSVATATTPARPYPAPPPGASMAVTVPGPIAAQRAAAAPVPGAPAAAPALAPPRAVADGGTAISSRRAAALAAAPHLRPVEPAPIDAEIPTEAVQIPRGAFDEAHLGAGSAVPLTSQPTAPGVELYDVEPSVVTDPGELPAEPITRQARPNKRGAAAPKAPPASGKPGKGGARLNFELFWGDVRREARSFSTLDPKKPLLAAAADTAAVPLWGFTLPEEQFQIAESSGEAYRVFIPPNAVVEKSSRGSDFMPCSARELESDGKRRFLTLSTGMAARLSEGEMSLVAFVAPPPERSFGNPLHSFPWLVTGIFVLLLGAFSSFLYWMPKRPELPDFTAKNLPPVAVRLIAPEPEKKEKAKKELEKIKQRADKAKKPSDKPKEVAEPKKKPTEKAVAKAPPPESKALKALAKLSAAGPATNDVLAAIDKMGSGPGSKNAKNNFKLSGLVGKDPIANAGLGTFGLGGGGKGGGATKGMEMLYGKGGGGIGALGAGGFGKGGKVGGTVARASARRVSAQGSIDREAVAKVINSHFQEVRACYERALLKDPGLAGKAVLEWSISTTGAVTSAKTKSSSLRNAEVEGCILRAIKTWKFPPARGGMVVITYPFLFNSVGY